MPRASAQARSETCGGLGEVESVAIKLPRAFGVCEINQD
jgi:hypothetical protein